MGLVFPFTNVCNYNNNNSVEKVSAIFVFSRLTRWHRKFEIGTKNNVESWLRLSDRNIGANFLPMCLQHNRWHTLVTKHSRIRLLKPKSKYNEATVRKTMCNADACCILLVVVDDCLRSSIYKQDGCRAGGIVVECNLNGSFDRRTLYVDSTVLSTQHQHSFINSNPIRK